MDIGPQKNPSSSAKINAEHKQVVSQLKELEESLYCIEISRDEKRHILYSKVCITHGPDLEYPKKILDENPNKAVLINCPTDNRMLIFSRDRHHLDAFLAGINFEQNKYDIWQKMYDDFIDFNISASGVSG